MGLRVLGSALTVLKLSPKKIVCAYVHKNVSVYGSCIYVRLLSHVLLLYDIHVWTFWLIGILFRSKRVNRTYIVLRISPVLVSAILIMFYRIGRIRC